MRTCGHRESAYKCSQNHSSYQPKSANPSVHQTMGRQSRGSKPTQWNVSHKKARCRLQHRRAWSCPGGCLRHTQARMSASLGLDSPTERKADLHKIHVQSRKQMSGPIFQGVRSLKQLMMRNCSCDYLSLLFMF